MSKNTKGYESVIVHLTEGLTILRGMGYTADGGDFGRRAIGELEEIRDLIARRAMEHWATVHGTITLCGDSNMRVDLSGPHSNQFTVGSRSPSDVVLYGTEQRGVAKQQCFISPTDQGWKLTNLDGRKEVNVRHQVIGDRCLRDLQDTILYNGDMITIGTYQMWIKITRPEVRVEVKKPKTEQTKGLGQELCEAVKEVLTHERRLPKQEQVEEIKPKEETPKPAPVLGVESVIFKAEPIKDGWVKVLGFPVSTTLPNDQKLKSFGMPVLKSYCAYHGVPFGGREEMVLNLINKREGRPINKVVSTKEDMGGDVRIESDKPDTQPTHHAQSPAAALTPKESEEVKPTAPTIVAPKQPTQDSTQRIEGGQPDLKSQVKALFEDATLVSLAKACGLAKLKVDTKDGGKMRAALKEWLATKSNTSPKPAQEGDNEGGKEEEEQEQVQDDKPKSKVRGTERNHDLPWCLKKATLFIALKKLGATSAVDAVPSGDVVKVSKDTLTHRDVRHYSYAAKSADLIGVVELESGKGYGYYLTETGVKVNPDEELAKAKKGAK